MAISRLCGVHSQANHLKPKLLEELFDMNCYIVNKYTANNTIYVAKTTVRAITIPATWGSRGGLSITILKMLTI